MTPLKEKILATDLLADQIALFYLGQVGFLLKYREKYILIDGYLSDYVDRNCCSDAVKWVRRYPSPICAEELDFVDFVFCTHAHFDHADPDTLSAIAQVNRKAKFFVSVPIVQTLVGYGIEKDRIVGMNCDASYLLCEGISVMAIPSAHEELHFDEMGNSAEVGFRFALGDTVLFHGGDGCPYDGLENKLMGVDILILPINGRDYYRRYICDIIGCFDSREAVLLAQHVGAKLLIPTHFDLYDVNCVNPAHFVDTVGALHPTQCYHIFKPGERYIYAD